jgi:NADH:ubiquinone oxidoreductase subunit 5 (subunit L)/multisubunit Na+/H+ antiporter MnhA subunit
MLWPIAFLAVLCLAIGIIPGTIVLFAARSASVVCHIDFQSSISAIATPMTQTIFIGVLGAALLGMAAILWLWRKLKLNRQEVSLGATWACGFTKPMPRMQYSASSYAQPLTRLFEGILRPKIEFHPPSGYWPKIASFHSHTPDPALDQIILPAFERTQVNLVSLRRFQRGRLQYYLLSVFLFLIALLLWKL